MPLLNDAVVIGTVLGLVFGAAVYYMYTRIVQVEKKMSLMENILLDLKVMTEQSILSNLQDSSNGNGSNLDHYSMHDNGSNNNNDAMNNDTGSNGDDGSSNNNVQSGNVREILLESEPRSQSPRNVVISKFSQSGNGLQDDEPFIPAVNKESVLDSINSNSVFTTDGTTSKMNVNYEAMTYKELIVDARKRKVIGYSHMSKSVLCDALRRMDSGEPQLPRGRRGSADTTATKEFPDFDAKQTVIKESSEPEAALSVFSDVNATMTPL